MLEQDKALLSDPRTEAIAEVSGADPTEVIEFAEHLADQDGESVSDELDEGVRELVDTDTQDRDLLDAA